MAKVNIEQVIDHLSIEIRRALAETIKSQVPNASFDEREAFRTFIRVVRRKCNTWEEVPDNYVEKQ